MKRRLLPWILSVSLCLSLLPAGSFSAEGESQMACSCTQYCLEAGTDETCMVCINDPANCTGKGTAAFSETPEITETVESAEGQSDWESEEQSETEPVTEEVSVESEEETTESSESETDFQEPPSEEVEESEETEETNETEGTEASGETEETEEETATQESGAQSEGISPTLEDIQELIYSLPGAEEMENLSAEEKEAVYAKVQEIRSMLEGLTEEERALLDTTRLEGFLMQTAEKKAKTLRVGDVAEIISADGSHSYASSLQAAIDSAPDGATVKLLENITDTISINVNKTLTLDGNGCSTGIIEINSGTVNVQNLVNGVLDVNGGTANIMGGIVTDLDCQGGTVNIRGGTVTDLNFRGDTVNIWSGSVGCLMLHSGTVNIMGGTVTNLDCWGGTANVASGTIDSLRGDGGTVNYYAIRIWLTNTAVSMIRGDTKTLSVDVQTDYKDPNGCLGTPPIKWESSDTNVVKVDTSGKITAVSNGTAEITASVPTMDSSGKPGSREDICTVTVSDGVKLSVAKQGEGTVSIETKPAYEDYYQKDTLVTVKATAEEGSCFVGWKGKDGAFVSDESTYKFHIQEDTELTAVFQEGVARVIYNGAARTYATLEKAFDAAGDGATIELLQDITEAISINVNKTLTLDGNGHSTGDIEINSGTVNVQNLRNGNEILYVNGGTLNIKSGSVVNRVNCSSGTVSISYGSVDILSCSGSGTASITGNSLLGGLYCYGGTVSITSSRVVGLFCYDSGMVNIMSGDVSSLICNSGEVNVAGGTIHGLKKNGGTVNYYATNIELTDTELSLKRGENKTLLATVTPAYNDPNDCLGTPTVTWKSDNPDVATVDESSGEIIAVGPGTAVITASVPTMDSPGRTGSTEAICTVTVSDGVKLSVAKQGEGELSIDSEQPPYKVGEDTYYQRNEEVTVTAEAGEEYYFAGWKGKDGEIVSPEASYTFKIGADTELTAVFQKGAAQIIKDGTKKTCATLDQAFDEAPDGATILLLQSSAETITVENGKTLTLDGNGCSTGDIKINSGIINVQNLVNGNGTLHVNGGTLNIESGSVAIVSCNSGGTVSITDGSVNTLACNGKVDISGGSVSTLTGWGGTVNITDGSVSTLNDRGGTINITDGSVSTLDGQGGTVNVLGGCVEQLDCRDGKINVAGGTIKGWKNKEGTVIYYATDIELADTKLSMNRWDTKTKTLSATVDKAYTDSTGEPTVTWKSDNDKVVTVDESSGLITAVGPGTAVITAFVQRMDSPETTSTISASCTVKVDGVKLDVKEPETGGTVSIEPEQPPYTAGEDTYYTSKVTVKAEAEEGHHFAGWQNKDGEIVSTEASYTFEMGADTELTAVFHEFDLAVYASDADSHWHPCKEDGCEAREGIEPHKGEETGDCTKEETCTVCGYVIRAAQAEHDWVEATCKEPKKCKREGCTQTEGEKADHKFTNYISDGNATCIADGTKTAECDYGCKETDTIQDVGSKLDHEKVIDEAVAPTAEAEGLTEGSHCKNCGAILVKQEVIAKLAPSDTEDTESTESTKATEPAKNTEPVKTTEAAKATETQAAGTSAAGQKTETTPNTGDEHHPLAYLWLMLAAGALGGVMIRRRKKA